MNYHNKFVFIELDWVHMCVRAKKISHIRCTVCFHFVASAGRAGSGVFGPLPSERIELDAIMVLFAVFVVSVCRASGKFLLWLAVE